MDKIRKYLGILLAAALALAGIFLLRRGSTKTHDSGKGVVDTVVEDLKPKTEAVVKELEEVKAELEKHDVPYEGRDIDIKKIVEDYEKL